MPRIAKLLLALCLLLPGIARAQSSIPVAPSLTAPNSGGSGSGSVTSVSGANGIVVTNGTLAPVVALPACTPAQLMIENSLGAAFACATLIGDCSITATGAITCTKTNGTAFGSLATMNIGAGLVSTGGNNLTLVTPVSVSNGGTQCGAPVLFASLPVSPTNGEICNVTDATTCTAGTAVSAGGGSTKCQVTYNGVSWMPAGGAVSAAAGGVTAVNATAPITSSGGATPTIAITNPLAIAFGGTGTAAAPSAAQIAIAQSGTAYAPESVSGDCTISSLGAVTCTKTSGTAFSALATIGVGTGLVNSGGNLNLTVPVSIANGGTGAITAPTAGQVAIAQSGTAYAPESLSGDCIITSAGAITCTKTGGVALGTLATASVPLSVANGGTGTTTPALTAGTGLGVSGTFPAQQFALTTPVTVANGGRQCGAPVVFASLPGSPTAGEICNVTDAPACTAGTPVTVGAGSVKCEVTYDGTNWQPAGGALSAAAGGVTSVTGSAPITSSGGTTPAIGLTTPLSVANGGTGAGTAPTAAQIAIAQSGTAYAPESVSGDCTISSVGAIVCTKTNGTVFGALATLGVGTGLTSSGGNLNLTTPVSVANGGTQCGAPTTFAGLPGSPVNGEVCNVTDALTCVVGAPVTVGGGTTKCEVTSNGTNWLPAGGAVASLGGVVNNIINVKDSPYNAVGNGVADDTAAIQAAINASCADGANKRPVYLPPTPGALCYKTTTPLLLNCATALTGPPVSLNGAASICQNYLGNTIIAQAAETGWAPPLASSVALTPSLAPLANVWQASTAYAKWKEILDSNGNIQFVKTAGTSGSGSHPAWSTTQGNTTTDGTVTWQMAMVGTQLATGVGSALDCVSPELFPGAGFGINNCEFEISNASKLDGAINPFSVGAFTIEFYVSALEVRPGVQDVRLFGIEPSQPMGSNIPGAIIYISAFSTGGSCTSNCLSFSVDIGGSTISAASTVAAGIFTLGVTHHMALSYDGTTVRLFKDGIIVASAAASGTWRIPPYENAMLNDALPSTYLSNQFNYALNHAYYDSLRISNSARYTSGFSAPTTKFASDANTILLLNFPTTAPTGTILGVEGAAGWNKNVYFPIGTSNGLAQLNPVYIGNLSLSDNGIWANWMINSTIENITQSGAGRTCVNFYNNDYQDTVHKYLCATGAATQTSVGFFFGNQSNQNTYDHLQCDGQYSCTGQLGGEGLYTQGIYTDRNSVIYAHWFVQAQALLESPTTDIEDTPPNFLGLVYSNGAYAPIEIHSGQLIDNNAGVGSDLVINTGQPFVVTGTHFGGNSTPVQFLNVLSAPTQPVTVKDAVMPNAPRTNASNGQYLSIQQNGKDEQSTTANLWACGAVNAGASVIDTDCDNCTFGSACVHTTGTLFCPEKCNGSTWAAY